MWTLNIGLGGRLALKTGGKWEVRTPATPAQIYFQQL